MLSSHRPGGRLEWLTLRPLPVFRRTGTTVNGAELLLKQLFFQPFFYDNCYRRKLTLQERIRVSRYHHIYCVACHACAACSFLPMACRGQCARATCACSLPIARGLGNARKHACSPPDLEVISLQEISTYQSRQRLRCPEPLKSLVPRRGLRRKNSLGAGSPSCCSPDQSSASSPVGSPSGPVGSAGEPVGSSSSSPPAEAEGLLGEAGEEQQDQEPCAVCLDEPRSALLVPCGHARMSHELGRAATPCRFRSPSPPPRAS